VYGLAGIRIGYGFAHEELIENLLKVKLPLEPSTLAQAAGIGALSDKEFLHRSLEIECAWVEIPDGIASGAWFHSRAVRSQLHHDGVVECGAAAAVWIANLLEEGIIVRPLKSFGLPQCVTISTGSD